MKCTDCNRETTYLITSEEVSNAGVGDIIEEFFAEDVEAATAYADEHYSDIEWCADKRQAVTVYLNTRLGGQTKEERTAKALAVIPGLDMRDRVKAG